MNNVLLRAISGAVYIAVIVACIVLGQYWFFGLTCAFMVLGLHEYFNLESARNGLPVALSDRLIGLASALSLWLTTVLAVSGKCTGAITFSGVFVATLATMLCRTVTVGGSSDSALRTAAHTALGVVYLAFPMALLNVVYTILPGNEGATLILVSLVCIWINDTGAFLVGSRIGRRRLCERLSPKKSWEGFWGGLLLVVVAMIVYALVEDKNVAMYALYGVVVSVLSTIGDLFESLLKRTAGVKDSGRLIPGHGGILDRIDSFLFVSYAIVLMCVLILIC